MPALRNANKSQAEKARVKDKIDTLRTLGERDFEIWRFFEQRADQIKGSLWTTATWLVALKGALLAFILTNPIVQFANSGIGITPNNPLVVLILSGLGLALVFLAFAIVDDIAHHVRINWYRASAAKGDYDAVSRTGRIYILYPLYVVEVFFAVAFAFLLWISWSGGLADWLVVVTVALAILTVTLYKTGLLQERPEPQAGAGHTQQHGSEAAE